MQVQRCHQLINTWLNVIYSQWLAELTVLSRKPFLEPRRHWNLVCNPCHVKQRAGRRKMRGVKGRKQLVRIPEDINLRGRQDGRRGYLIKHGITAAKVCVCISVCLSSWRITGEL